jgi:hypothetical protein
MTEWECAQCGNTTFEECDDGYCFCDCCGCSCAFETEDAADDDESATDLEERLHIALRETDNGR